MPQQPLPPSNTPRYYLDYLAGGVEHTFQVRTTQATTDSAALQAIETFILAMEPQMTAITVVGARKADQGSDVTIPRPWPYQEGYGEGNLGLVDNPRYLTFVGRSIGGRKNKLILFGGKIAVTANWRYTAIGLPFLLGPLAVLANTPGVFVGIDGLQTEWYNYVNVGYHDHFVDEARTS